MYQVSRYGLALYTHDWRLGSRCTTAVHMYLYELFDLLDLCLQVSIRLGWSSLLVVLISSICHDLPS